MKRHVYLLLLVVFGLGMFSCQKPPETPQTTPAPTPAPIATSPTPETPKEKPQFLIQDGFRAVAFEVDGGLVKSIKRVLRSDEPYAENLAAQMTNALMWDLDHRRDLKKGDRCKLLYKTTRDRFKVRLYGLLYTSKKYDQMFRRFFFWEKGKKYPGYFSEAGVAVVKKMRNPPLAKFDKIVSLFRKGSKTNLGVKYRVPTGTQISMPFPALVTRVNWDLKQAGLGVEVTYPGTGLTAQFIHLSAISGKVMPGQTVPVQTLFARTGISGATQIPHLEYRLFRQTEERIEPVDPFEFHGFDSYSIGPKNYKNFVSVKHQILAYLQNVNYKSK